MPATFSVSNGLLKVHTDDTGNHHVTWLEVVGSTSKTSITITTPKGTAPLIVDKVTADGSIGSFVAKTTNLGGDLTIDGGVFGSLWFNDVESHTLTIGSAAKAAMTLSLNHVQEVNLTSGTPIKTLSVTHWLDLDGTQDVITAPWIGTLAAKGDLTYPGNFEADLVLSGVGAGKYALGDHDRRRPGRTRIWDVTGAVSSLTVRNETRLFELDALSMGSLTLAGVTSAGRGRARRPAQVGRDPDVAGRTVGGRLAGDPQGVRRLHPHAGPQRGRMPKTTLGSARSPAGCPARPGTSPATPVR